jgi:hypothetical protein
VKRTGIDEAGNPFADRQFPVVMLTLNPISPTQLARPLATPLQFLDFRLPAHAPPQVMPFVRNFSCFLQLSIREGIGRVAEDLDALSHLTDPLILWLKRPPSLFAQRRASD